MSQDHAENAAQSVIERLDRLDALVGQRLVQLVVERTNRLEERVHELSGHLRIQNRRHLSVKEFAQLAGLSAWYVRNLCLSGRLVASKRANDRKWVLTAQELDRYRRDGLLPAKG